MANVSEAQSLLQEIADLKRMIDSHKSLVTDVTEPYQTRSNFRKRSTQFYRNRAPYGGNQPLPNASSLYSLNRTSGHRPCHTVPYVPFKDPNFYSFPNQKSYFIGHQHNTSRIAASHEQNSVNVINVRVGITNSAVMKAPSSTSTPSTSTSTLKSSHLSSSSAQTIVHKLNAIKNPQPTIPQKTCSYISPPQKITSKLQETSNQTIANKLPSTKTSHAASTVKTIPLKGKPSQIQITSAPATVLVNNVPGPDIGSHPSKNVSLKLTPKPVSKFLNKKSVSTQSQSSFKSPPLKYNFVRPDYTLKLSGRSETCKSVSVYQVRKSPSKYKLVATPKKIPSKVKSPVFPVAKSPMRRQVNAAKYSWSVKGSQEPKKLLTVGKNTMKSRYRLSKLNAGVSPKLFRHVNKYSVKYVPPRQKNSLRICKPQLASGRHFKQCLIKGKSDLVVIGGILYKSSKNKLARTAEEKTRNSGIRHPASQRIVNVRGERFSMDLNRKVLQRLPTMDQKSSTKLQTSKGPSPAEKPKGLTRIDIGGETYIQTRPGVLVRSNTNKLRNLANRVVNRSIFRLRASKGKSQQYCLFYNKFGKCNNKEKGLCPYIHDAEKIAICKRLLRGECTVERCPFSHTVCPSKMPVCTFFLHGRCNNDSCNYRHVNVNPKADVCLEFAKGYCPLGEKCKNWHVSVCPQFEQTGKCDKAKKCPLKHQRRAAKVPKRKAEANSDSSSTTSDSRPSADETREDKPSAGKRLPSFISLENDSGAGTPPHKMQKDVPLQIKPDFLKLS